jgi:Lon protease-like protein
MSENLEKVSGLQYIPVFPLPLVLLPNEILPLHIFEPRYRQMMDDIKEDRSIFGISHFESSDDKFSERPEVGSVGCAAEVRDIQELADGRSNIVTAGVARYRLLEYVDLGAPYLTAEVEFFEDTPEEGPERQALADDVFDLFERIAKAAFRISGNQGQFPEIQRADPEPLSFLVTAAFSFDNSLKYQLLEMTSTTERLSTLKGYLSQAVDQMESNAEIIKVSQTNGHSKKKLDL